METILLIDDDVELCAMLTDYLNRHGFRAIAVHHGETGLRVAIEKSASLVLLDVMLPGINGFEVLRRLRAVSTVSVLLLTARGEDDDRIVGLETGADDYLAKPFNPRELLARIRAILRRSSTAENSSAKSGTSGKLLRVDGIELDTAARSVCCDGADLELTDIEFSLLEALMRSPGDVVTREELAVSVLGRKFHPFDRSLDMHVSRLRRKLDDSGRPGDQVKTIRGVGYQLAVRTMQKIAGE
ncbi:response regulator transcription factor [Paracidobacterium acidisoli]|uniref:DNA-binding response regulator n=1 Tax=Paracidobacterium acidisoli TaxID=2303751 RepID=A0A372IIS4_9BACT|nr:response regulator transcription factor [Paracidobacterium acidisoli]MBT9333300.1 response regulator transcription factor [Paracidobacterium acidisoli]